MDSLTLHSDAGPLGFIGRIHTDRRRPLLLLVNGSFPPKDYLLDILQRFQGANALIVNLPGMRGVPWAKTSVTGLTRALEAAVNRLAPDVPVVAFGASTGNLVSLGLQLPTICRRVAVEPFFQTQHLWPFIADSRERMAQFPEHPLLAHYFWEFFGIGPDTVENRDYRRLLSSITVPTDVLMGDELLLPARSLAPGDPWPSFTSQQDREALAANPLVTLHVGPPGSGHGFGSKGRSADALKDILHTALLAASELCL